MSKFESNLKLGGVINSDSTTRSEMDLHSRLMDHQLEIRKLQSDKITGESPENREKRLNYIRSSKEFKEYRKLISELLNEYDKTLSSGAYDNLGNINMEIEEKLNIIDDINSSVQSEIEDLIRFA